MLKCAPKFVILISNLEFDRLTEGAMAYCDKCGAYIPDGQSKCLACGYDAEEEKRKAAAQAQRAEFKKSNSAAGAPHGMYNEELRAKYEEQRKKQQEQSRIWAERERERREEERREEERRRQERAEREQENRANYGADFSESSFAASNYGSASDYAPGDYYYDKDSKLFAILSYFSFLSFIPIFFRRKDKFAMFHAKQGLVLLIYGVVADALSALPLIGWMFPLFRIYCIISGVSAASKRQFKPLPYIGRFADFFKL